MIGTIIELAAGVVTTECVEHVVMQVVRHTRPRHLTKAGKIMTRVGVSAIGMAVGDAAMNNAKEIISTTKSLRDYMKNN